MDYEIELKEEQSQPVISKRFRTNADNLPKELGRAYGDIVRYLNEIGEKPTDIAFAAHYNMNMDDLDVEAGFIVPKTLVGKDDIKAGEIPSGKQVSCVHKGPYIKMEAAYHAIMQWVQEKGYKPTGVAYEFYLNSPYEVAEDELITKVMLPLTSEAE
jgi:effector-binding domain-containing protein